MKENRTNQQSAAMMNWTSVVSKADNENWSADLTSFSAH